MLLCQPVSTVKIVTAKLCCASLIACIGVLLTLSLTSFSVSFIDLTKIGASFNLNTLTITALFIVVIAYLFLCIGFTAFCRFSIEKL